MAFDNEIFPQVPLYHDVSRSVVDPVSVVTNGNYERRYKRQQWERFTWEIPPQVMTNTKKEEIRQFLMQRNNGLNTFKYTDNELSTFTNVRLSHAGTGDTWYLYLPFGANTAGNTHPMFRLETTDFTATVNSVSKSILSYQLTNGIPSFDIQDATNPADDVRITGTAYFVVRLDSSFNDTLFALNCNNVAQGHNVAPIRLVEVHGE